MDVKITICFCVLGVVRMATPYSSAPTGAGETAARSSFDLIGDTADELERLR